MKFIDCSIPGAWIVEYEPAHDERGTFTDSWQREVFDRQGLFTAIDQAGSAYNIKTGTLRGMHFQLTPFAQEKLVRCSAGAIYDVIVDLRPASSSGKRWFGLELAAADTRALYVPAGCAHGYLTLSDQTTVDYLISGRYSPQHASGVRWDDPTFAIRWPAAPKVISPRDAQFPDFNA